MKNIPKSILNSSGKKKIDILKLKKIFEGASPLMDKVSLKTTITNTLCYEDQQDKSVSANQESNEISEREQDPVRDYVTGHASGSGMNWSNQKGNLIEI